MDGLIAHAPTSQYDSIKPGVPLVDVVETNNGRRFSREFKNMRVMVDCNTGEYSLMTKSVDPTPSPSYISVYEDSTFKFKIQMNTGRTIFRNCDWDGNRATSSRCKLTGVSSMCPKTCNSCSICLDSFSRMKFLLNGKLRARDCSWTSRKANRCKIEGMQ